MLNDTKLYEKVQFAQNAAGAVARPMDGWLVLRGIKTLAVGLERDCWNAKRGAEFLVGHAEVSKAIYPAFN
jgi:cystathionine beta-lyase/cystathionine gamma-synthase